MPERERKGTKTQSQHRSQPQQQRTFVRFSVNNWPNSSLDIYTYVCIRYEYERLINNGKNEIAHYLFAGSFYLGY